MKFNFRGIGFIHTLLAVGLEMVKKGPKLTVLILICDAINVVCRAGAILTLSIMASAMQNNGLLSVRGFEFQLPETLFGQGLLGAGIISFLLGLSALAGFFSVALARRMARRLNESAIDRIMSGLGSSPQLTSQVPYFDPDIFNRLLTQNAIHYGMLGETFIKMGNPTMMFILAWLIVTFQLPALGFGIVIFVILFAPIFLKLFLKTSRVAQDFYADSATIMGQGVSRDVLTLNPQFGIYSDPSHEKKMKHHPYMKNFLDALDSNILANERMGLLVGIIGAMIIAIVIIINSYLVSHDRIDIAGMIALTGGFIYLLASARTVASMLTNLVRFYPQVRLIRDFIVPLQTTDIDPEDKLPLPEMITLTARESDNSEQQKLRLNRGGNRIGLIVPGVLTRFTLQQFIDPLLTPGLPKETVAANMVFVSSRYRFKSDQSVLTILTGARPENESRAIDVASHLEVLEEFNGLENGLATTMSEEVWSKLTGPARTSLRLIPLMSRREPRIVFIDVDAVKNLNPNKFDSIFEPLKDCFVFITMQGTECPNNLAETFIQTDGKIIMGIGGREWLNTLDMSNTNPVLHAPVGNIYI